MSEAKRILLGTAAQASAQVVTVLAMLAIITVLGRSLTLSEFGTYGLLIAISSYVLVVQLSIEGATVRAVAAAGDDVERRRVMSSALFLYVLAGFASAGVIAAAGVPLVGVLGVPRELRAAAREAVIAVAVITALGWPVKVFQDVLRGMQRFFIASVAESAANLAYVGVVIGLVAARAPLWAVIAAGASLPFCIGFASALATLGVAGTVRPSLGAASRAQARELASVGGHLFLSGLADLLIYSADRIVLGAFRPVSDVGLYEGAVRPHNLVRQLQATLVLTVMPTASGYLRANDQGRLRELVLRGSRYVGVAITPVAAVLCILSAPLLESWLGSRYGPAAPALAILLSYWIVNANLGVAGAVLVSAGHARFLGRYAMVNAVTNLALSLLLTPPLGLDGVAIGTSATYILFFPVFVRAVLQRLPVTLPELTREVWLPTYCTTVIAAVPAGAVMLISPPHALVVVILLALGSLAVAWVTYALVFLGAQERELIKELVSGRRKAAT